MHHYPISFSWNNYIVPSFNLTKSKYRTTIRAPKLWNIILIVEEKLVENPVTLKATIKRKLVLLKNVIVVFLCMYKTFNSLIYNKNFLNQKLEITSERLARDFMIRPTCFSASSFPLLPLFHLLPGKLQYWNIFYMFLYFNIEIWYILSCLYYFLFILVEF